MDNNQRFEEIYKLTEDHIKHTHEKIEALTVAQEANTEAIFNLSNSTRDLVNAWQDARATLRVVSKLTRFVKWVAGLAGVGIIVKWVLERVG